MFGVIIGVGALVAILSLIDGLEAYARNELADDGQLSEIEIYSVTSSKVDGIPVPRAEVAVLTEEIARELMDSLPYPARAELTASFNALAHTPDAQSHGIQVYSSTEPTIRPLPEDQIVAGHLPGAELTPRGYAEIMINEHFSERLGGEADDDNAVLGQLLLLGEDTLQVSGVFAVEDSEASPLLAVAAFPVMRRIQAEGIF